MTGNPPVTFALSRWVAFHRRAQKIRKILPLISSTKLGIKQVKLVRYFQLFLQGAVTIFQATLFLSGRS